MAVYELTLPVDNETIEKLHVGDIIYLNGQSVRRAIRRTCGLRRWTKPKAFPRRPEGAAIFHAGL
mgnify:CR=1 FL=1